MNCKIISKLDLNNFSTYLPSEMYFKIYKVYFVLYPVNVVLEGQ